MVEEVLHTYHHIDSVYILSDWLSLVHGMTIWEPTWTSNEGRTTQGTRVVHFEVLQEIIDEIDHIYSECDVESLFSNIPREENWEADGLANQALNELDWNEDEWDTEEEDYDLQNDENSDDDEYYYYCMSLLSNKTMMFADVSTRTQEPPTHGHCVLHRYGFPVIIRFSTKMPSKASPARQARVLPDATVACSDTRS
ncbi:hypothetical protein QBC36DRAFT_315315 [Triangularia setosa]|uniref:Uncharacterized protein n=1 Tax=Triangularia setosa TaxID=2587417 RepID=A0AAN6W057_9PEZI|nr:hypothetical protein QBC36DRAFT_315315 [Podospora setosa]